MKRRKLGEILVEAGLITGEQLSIALTLQKVKKKRIGIVLIELGYVNETEVTETLSRQLAIQLIDCHKTRPSRKVLALVPRDIAEKKVILPVEIKDNSLLVVMANPLDWQTLDDLAFKTGVKIIVAVSSESNILTAIEKHYGAYDRIWDNL